MSPLPLPAVTTPLHVTHSLTRRALRLATKETGMNKYFFLVGQLVKAFQMLVFPLLTLQANSNGLQGACPRRISACHPRSPLSLSAPAPPYSRFRPPAVPQLH